MSQNQISLQKSNPVTLLQTALEKGVDTEQLEKLMNLQERWEAKEAKKRMKEYAFIFCTWSGPFPFSL